MIDSAHAIAHNKVMIIDGETVVTGSFNFTKAAEEKNAENLLIIRDKALAEKYIANWKLHAGHSEPYKGRENKVDKRRGGSALNARRGDRESYCCALFPCRPRKNYLN